MDPDVALAEIGDLADEILSTTDHDVHARLAPRLAERVQDLDAWLSRGGFLPTGWAAKRQPVGNV